MDILISGSIAYDRIMTFPGKFEDHILPDKIQILNVCFLVDGLEEKFGGTGANIAYSLKLMDENPLLMASVGKDFDRYSERFEKFGLSQKAIRRFDDDYTPGCYITTDLKDNQITGFNPGAMKFRSDYDLSEFDPENTMLIVSPNCLDDMRGYPATCRELGIPYIMDPGQNIPAFSGEELKDMIFGAYALTSNDYELQLIMNATGLSKEEILSGVGMIITTLGEDGSLITTDDAEYRIPAAKAKEVKDPTGAGDAYRSGLLKGLSMGKDIVTAAQIGAVAAVYAVEKNGTQEHSYTNEEFWARYEENFGKLD